MFLAFPAGVAETFMGRLKVEIAVCSAGWKGQDSYYTVVVDGKENKDAALFYPSPKPTANRIKLRLQFGFLVL